MDEWTQYAWLDDDTDDALVAVCLGIATGASYEVVLSAFAVEEDSCGAATLAEAWAMSRSDFGNDIVQIATLESSIVSVEPNGWHGIDENVAVELSRSGSYVAFSWNVNALMTFVYARDGALRRQFDPLLYDCESEPENALPEERDLPFPREDSSALTPRRAALALIERLTGVQITRAWLVEETRPTFRRAVALD